MRKDAIDWLQWAIDLASQGKNVDYRVVAKILADKCAELQQQNVANANTHRGDISPFDALVRMSRSEN